ncbi:ankyrin repeat domain-containing protein [Wolbachia endosymbiont of Dirofilaria (Dirofilaria) immitis]|uniref:ankyrin repeat domain-containing protein n=1 Tax=Wolbachia endosymbiont of Dirofilaria (Dirofilaria) immitis TaxID=1812115 RepID=UPI00158C9EC8|nr:ankyrin repeat domain-containing protein [Wolbachia endosymbiont of Dirofilaria (Dirofilaria) immitis]QKX02031.1 ankyrin repeat domain-containing protein [Wolbachia endosymbiont of Dirofilaria (Dirofilaria) immitis]
MNIDINALTTNVNKLEGCIDKNERQEQERKSEQLYNVIEKKVKKEEHKHKKPRSRDRIIKKYKRLIKKGASLKVLAILKETLRKQEKYYRHYTQCFIPVLNKKISKELNYTKKEEIRQVILEVTCNSKHCFNSTAHKKNNYKNSKGSKPESGYGSNIEDDYKVEINNRAVNNSIQLLKAIKDQNDRKFRKHLKSYIDISDIKDKKEKNILYPIVSLKRKQKLKFFSTLIKTVSKKNPEQLINSQDQEKTSIQEATINKITKEKHKSHTLQDNNNTLKFFVKLLKYRTSYSNLELFIEELQGLREEQKAYYCNFSEKLTELVKQSKLEQKSDIEKKIKDIITRIINILDINNNYLLHSAINNYDKKLFKKLLQKGLNVSLKDVNGNNALHLIVSKLKKEQKLEFLNILLKVGQKEQFINAINNNKNQEGQTPLHQLLQHIQERSKKSSLISKIKNIVKKEFKNTNKYKVFKLLMENGADITIQDKKENNALHYIVPFKGKQRIAYLKLILSKDEFSYAINAINEKGQTPLHQLLQYMQKKSKKPSLASFENTKRYKALKLLLENGADITIKDSNKKNALHYIALLKGEQKVICLDLVVKYGNISEDKLNKAINTSNGKKQTPLQVALTSKIVKDRYNHHHNPKNHNNTIKFCVKLLQNGADPKQLILSKPSWNKEYYKTIKEIEKSMGKLLIPNDMRTKLKLNFGKKFKARDIVKHVNNITYKVVTTLVFAALTCAVVFSIAQGSITIITASFTITAIGVCYLICLNLENIYKGFKKIKEELIKEKQTTPQSNIQYNSPSSKKIENQLNDLEKQKELQNQLKHTENLPNSKIDSISISQLTQELLEFNKQINKSSFLAL